jgi:hypothetical protein
MRLTIGIACLLLAITIANAANKHPTKYTKEWCDQHGWPKTGECRYTPQE